LGDLENKILGATRSQQDVPGWMIADLFFDYLHTRDARPLLGVFYHNEMDVVTLAALLAHMTDLCQNPLSDSIEYGSDLIAIGKLYADLGDLERASEIYQRGIQMEDVQGEDYWQALKEFSFIQKKRENIKAACLLWEEAAKNEQIYAHVELAKIYEHRIKDLSSAYQWTQAALQIVTKPSFPIYAREQVRLELEYRLARLERKRIQEKKKHD
jgi:tetratricopeptide (TPR) repeat protein